jgi:hypothetical protein
MWTQVVNPDDPHPVVTRSSLGTLPDEIDRVDLRTGTRTEWLYRPGEWVGIVGLDSRGAPLMFSHLWEYDPNAQLFLVAAANSERLIYKGAVVQVLGGGITDAHGTWIGGQRGIYLYTSSGSLVKVSDHPGSLANSCF